MYTHTGAVKGRWGRRFGESFHPMGPYQTGDGEWIASARRAATSGTTSASRPTPSSCWPTTRCTRRPSASSGPTRSTPLVAPWLAAAHRRRGRRRVPGAPRAGEPAARLHRGAARPSSSPPAATSRPGPDVGAGSVVPAAAVPRRRRRGARRPAADLGADTAAFTARAGRRAGPCRAAVDRPARDTRLLEFGIAWAGPLAARTLGDLGVDVVKVEHPMSRGFGTGGGMTTDLPWRWGELGPPPIRAEIFPGAEPGERRWNRMGTWNKMNRSKRSLLPRRQAGRGRGGPRRADRVGRHGRAQLHAARRPLARRRPRAPARAATTASRPSR